jgi:hypothetical protein
MWEMTRVKTFVIPRMTKIKSEVNAVELLLIADQYKVQSWMVSALNRLSHRANPITVEEGNKMGMAYALKISWLRENRVSRVCDHTSSINDGTTLLHDYHKQIGRISPWDDGDEDEDEDVEEEGLVEGGYESQETVARSAKRRLVRRC